MRIRLETETARFREEADVSRKQFAADSSKVKVAERKNSTISNCNAHAIRWCKYCSWCRRQTYVVDGCKSKPVKNTKNETRQVLCTRRKLLHELLAHSTCGFIFGKARLIDIMHCGLLAMLPTSCIDDVDTVQRMRLSAVQRRRVNKKWRPGVQSCRKRRAD